MSVEENKTAIRRLIEEVWNKGNLAIIPECVDVNFVFRGPVMELKGLEGYEQMITMLRTAFPDLHMVLEDMVAEDDKMAIRYTLSGTFRGNLGDIAPTGKQAILTGAIFFRFSNGKEVDALEFIDQLDMYKKLGVSPPSQ
jgi:predicted ester cyclase